MELTVTEVVELINQVRHERESLFEMIRTNVQESVGKYLSTLMDMELTEFLGRQRATNEVTMIPIIAMAPILGRLPLKGSVKSE